MDTLYREHLDWLQTAVERALAFAAEAGETYDSIVFHAGSEQIYHRDDHPVPFHSDAHFTRFAPLTGPGHVVHFRVGKTMRLLRFAPADFWCEAEPWPDHPVRDSWESMSVLSEDELVEKIGSSGRTAFIGSDTALAGRLGADVEPPRLLAALDWERATKTPYEIECLRRAIARVAPGFHAVREAITDRPSEHELYRIFLAGFDAHPTDVSFEPIVAWDRHASVLHYPRKSRQAPDPATEGLGLLLDAGACYHGYGSDLTRTFLTDTAPVLYRQVVEGLHDIQRRLVESMAPGNSFVDLHRSAERQICTLLHSLDVLRVDADQAIELGLSRPFFPHGLGHHLGVQVHDAGGKLTGPEGEIGTPPEDCPFLRTTRPMAASQVLTIEPGIYFIPMLLDPWRAKHPDAFNDVALQELLPCGGVRIEDDVLVTDTGFEGSGFEDLSVAAVPKSG